MKKILSLLFCLCLLFTTALASAAATDISDGTVTVTAAGQPPTDNPNLRPIQLQLGAKHNALVNARELLAAAVVQVRIDDSTSVLQMLASSESLMARMKSMIKNAALKSEQTLPGNTHEVTLWLPVYGPDSIAQLVLPMNANPEALPTVAAYSNGEGCYTGVVIDCTALNPDTAFCPAIVSETGDRLYSYANLDYQRVLKQGAAAYLSPEAKSPRAGSNPLRLTAIALQSGVNPVLSAADADKLLAENQLTHFLDYCNVIILK